MQRRAHKTRSKIISSFIDYIIDVLSKHGSITQKRMFGGYGLYSNRIFFAIIIDDELYFKTDAALAAEYKNFGSFPFTYKRDDKFISMSYWYVPPEVIEDSDLLKDWYNKSLNIAKNKKI